MTTNTNLGRGVKSEHMNRIYGYVYHDRSVYIITNYAANGNLMEYILKHGSSISLKRKLEFALTIVEALMRIHSIPMVHRDLRTSSFLVKFIYLGNW